MTNKITAALGAASQGAVVPFVMNKRQVAAYLGVCEKTIDNLRNAGLLHASKHKGLVRFRKSDADDFLELTNSRGMAI
jgi:predicted site-specific integrase-resolvase